MPKAKRKGGKKKGGVKAIERRFFSAGERNRGRIEGRARKADERSLFRGTKPPRRGTDATVVKPKRKST